MTRLMAFPPGLLLAAVAAAPRLCRAYATAPTLDPA